MTQQLPEKFKALLLEEHHGNLHSAVKSLPFAELPDGEVLIKVEYSTLNYKDALIMMGIGQMVKHYPIVPGVDFAGVVVDSADPSLKKNDRVILTGWRYGELHWGGYAQYARAKAEHLIRCPDQLTLRQAMAFGTAGLTAAMALNELEDHGLRPDQGPVIVTGASGGVGSVATILMASNQYQVFACTGRPQLHRYLKELGATDILDRKQFADGPKKLLDHERWFGAIDSVGSTTLATILTQMHNRASVAACGLAGGSDLPANLMPFLLRGVRMIGIASADCPTPLRLRAWQRLADEVPLDKLEKTITECKLSDINDLSTQMLQGLIQGRVIVNLSQS